MLDPILRIRLNRPVAWVRSAGARVPNANIACKSVKTGVARNVVAGNLGAYANTALPVGSYDLEPSAPGFKTEVRK